MDAAEVQFTPLSISVNSFKAEVQSLGPGAHPADGGALQSKSRRSGGQPRNFLIDDKIGNWHIPCLNLDTKQNCPVSTLIFWSSQHIDASFGLSLAGTNHPSQYTSHTEIKMCFKERLVEGQVYALPDSEVSEVKHWNLSPVVMAWWYTLVDEIDG